MFFPFEKGCFTLPLREFTFSIQNIQLLLTTVTSNRNYSFVMDTVW